MSHIGGATRGGPETLKDQLARLSLEAFAFTPRGKAEALTALWLDLAPAPHSDRRRALVSALALDLVLVAPSFIGTTAFDRLLRAMKDRAGTDRAAAAAMCRSRYRIARLAGRLFEDLATGEKQVLIRESLRRTDMSGPVFGRFVAAADGAMIAAGAVVALDERAMAVVRPFMHPRRGLTNPIRCAEALFRHIARHGAPDDADKPALPFKPDTSPLDRLAADWAALDGDPGPEDLAQARRLVGIGTVLDAVVSVSVAGAAGAKPLAAAYRRIAAVLVEAMAAREAFGGAHRHLDRVAAEIDAAIARGDWPVETRTLFATLREQARLASGRAAGATGDLDKLMQRIRALREKTVEQGCTEQEAMAAAGKVAELLDRYGLSLSEPDLRQQSCEGIGVETNRKRRGPIDDCIPHVARFCDCRVWSEASADGTLRYIFFGLPGDVQAAAWLNDLIGVAFATETVSFQAGEFYAGAPSSQRRTATNSFQMGLARGIGAKLASLREARGSAAGANGRALVPVKDSIIDLEMQRLGLAFRSTAATRRKIIPDAFESGKEAGARFEYRPGIAAA